VTKKDCFSNFNSQRL